MDKLTRIFAKNGVYTREKEESFGQVVLATLAGGFLMLVLILLGIALEK